MKKHLIILLTILALNSGLAQGKSLTLLSKPETNSASIATVQSGDRLIPIFSPEKSDWIKVADPSNGNVGWLKRQDLGLNQQQPRLYQKRIEKVTGDKSKGPYQREVFEYKGTENLSQEQVKQLFEHMEQQQLRMQAAMQSMFNNMMNHISDFDHMTPDNIFNQDRRPFLIVPDDDSLKAKGQNSSVIKRTL